MDHKSYESFIEKASSGRSLGEFSGNSEEEYLMLRRLYIATTRGKIVEHIAERIKRKEDEYCTGEGLSGREIDVYNELQATGGYTIFDEVISGRDCDELKNYLAECGESDSNSCRKIIGEWSTLKEYKIVIKLLKNKRLKRIINSYIGNNLIANSILAWRTKK